MITLEEICFNQLSPWHPLNEGEELYRELIAGTEKAPHYGTGIYFETLTRLFREMGLKQQPEITAEWRVFAETGQKIPKGPFLMLESYRHPHPKVRFYAQLLANSGIAEIITLVKDLKKHTRQHYRKDRLRRLMPRLERCINISAPDREHQEEDLLIMQLTKLTAILIYLEMIRQNIKLIHTGMLKINHEAIHDQLAMIAMGSQDSKKLTKTIVDKYKNFFRHGADDFAKDTIRHNNMQKSKGKANASSKGVVNTETGQVKDGLDHNTEEKSEDCIIGSGEAKKILGISKSTLYRWRVNGLIKPYSQPNPKGRYKYKRSEIVALAKKNKT